MSDKPKRCGDCWHCRLMENVDERAIDKGLYECIAKRRDDTRKHLKHRGGIVRYYVLQDNASCEDFKLKKK